MHPLKRLFRLVVSTPGIVPKLLRESDAGVIFMLHRFPDAELGHRSDHDLTTIRAMLAYLRRHRFELVPLSTMFDRAGNGERLNGAIAFTIDDGYLDHAKVGAPLFAEFDCPVTTFVTTGFLDGQLWFWWDQIDYVFRNTRRNKLTVAVGPSPAELVLQWASPAEQDREQGAFTEACKRVPQAEKVDAIARLAIAADVEIPVHPPTAYAPMSWSDARRCEQSGMTFGPHTVTHPILSRTPDAQSRFEIEESWRRLASEVAHPVPVFCYPNGQADDFGVRETNVMADAGLQGAVVGMGGYATGDYMRDQGKRFHVRRFGMPPTLTDVIQYVRGIERIKERLRAGRK